MHRSKDKANNRVKVGDKLISYVLKVVYTNLVSIEQLISSSSESNGTKSYNVIVLLVHLSFSACTTWYCCRIMQYNFLKISSHKHRLEIHSLPEGIG